jgi:hypothetical protein
MNLQLAEHATERSALGIAVSFFDSSNAAASPKTLNWSLTDTDGNTINSRKDVAVESPGTTETIVLRGDDLQIVTPANRQEGRILIVSGTYDDSVLGLDTPFYKEIRFVVDAIKDVF